MDLGSIGGTEWAGWTLGEDGKMYAPEWRQGLHPGHIRALPYLQALDRDLRRQLKAAQDALQEMERLCLAAEHQARCYRRLVSQEARLGLMLSRVTDS